MRDWGCEDVENYSEKSPASGKRTESTPNLIDQILVGPTGTILKEHWLLVAVVVVVEEEDVGVVVDGGAGGAFVPGQYCVDADAGGALSAAADGDALMGWVVDEHCAASP